MYHLYISTNSGSTIKLQIMLRGNICTYIDIEYNNYFNKKKEAQLMRLRYTFLVPNTSAALQRTSAAKAHLPERRYLLMEQTLNKTKSLIYGEATEDQQFQNEKGEI
jgi:hypothetical protein